MGGAMRYLFVFLSVTTLLFVLCAPARGEQLRFGYDEFYPLTYTEDGRASGETIDLLREACRRLGHEPVFKRMTFARLLESTKTGMVDAMASAFRTRERTEYLYFSPDGQGVDRVSLYVYMGYAKSLRSLDDITTETVGAVRGYFYGEGVLEALGDNVRYVKDSKTLFKMVAERRFEAVLVNSLNLQHFYRELKLEFRIRKAFEVTSFAFHTAFSKTLGPRGQELATAFGREMQAIRKEWREQGRIE